MAFSLEGALRGIGTGMSQVSEMYSASLEAKKQRDFTAQQSELQAQRMMHIEELRNRNELARQKAGFEHTEAMQKESGKQATTLAEYQERLARERQAIGFEQQKEMLGLTQAGELELYDKKLASDLKKKEAEIKMAKTQADSILKEKLAAIDALDPEFLSDDLKQAAKFKVLTGVDLFTDKGNKVSDEQWLKAVQGGYERFDMMEEKDQKRFMRQGRFGSIDEARVAYGINEGLSVFPKKSSDLPKKEKVTSEQFLSSIEDKDIQMLVNAPEAVREFNYRDIEKKYGKAAADTVREKVTEALGEKEPTALEGPSVVQEVAGKGAPSPRGYYEAGGTAAPTETEWPWTKARERQKAYLKSLKEK